jgi:hypothetical protein
MGPEKLLVFIFSCITVSCLAQGQQGATSTPQTEGPIEVTKPTTNTNGGSSQPQRATTQRPSGVRPPVRGRFRNMQQPSALPFIQDLSKSTIEARTNVRPRPRRIFSMYMSHAGNNFGIPLILSVLLSSTSRATSTKWSFLSPI